MMTLFSLMTLNNPRQHGLTHLSVQLGHSPECRCMRTKAFLASPGRCPIDTLTSHAWKSPSPPLPQPAPHGPPISVNGNWGLLVAPVNTSVAFLTLFILPLFTRAISKSCWLYLENTPGIQAPVTTSSATTLTPVAIISRLDYRYRLNWFPCLLSLWLRPPFSLFSTAAE